MKYFKTPISIAAILICCAATTAFSQKAKPIKIVDPGELYSTYDLQQTEKDEISKQVKSGEYEYILTHCNEDSWPEGINTLDERLENVEAIKNYKAFKVAKLDAIYVVKIPAKDNKKIKGDMKPEHDFYFIIGEKGIE